MMPIASRKTLIREIAYGRSWIFPDNAKKPNIRASAPRRQNTSQCLSMNLRLMCAMKKSPCYDAYVYCSTFEGFILDVANFFTN